MSEYPLISVLVPMWNRAHTIRRTLDSILASDYPNYEIIVADNDSDDDSVAIVKEFQSAHSNISLIENPENVGAVNNWLICLQEAKGDLIKIVWSDDEVASNTLTKLARPLLDSEDISVSFCKANIVAENQLLKVMYDLKSDRSLDLSDFISGFSLKVPYIPYSPGAAMIRRKVADDSVAVMKAFCQECYNKAIGPDVILMYHTIAQTGVVYVADTEVIFNEDDTSITKLSRKIVLNNCYDKSIVHVLKDQKLATTYLFLRYLRMKLDFGSDRSIISEEHIADMKQHLTIGIIFASLKIILKAIFRHILI